jgi:7-cyano-7-deazaguanine synthase
MSRRSALVLFSGGQDSAVCLAWALDRFGRVETCGFDYGQRHRIELDCRGAVLDGLRALRPDWGRRLGEDVTLDLGVLGAISDTSLTRETAIEMTASGLPSTFVPGRNLIFFTLAAAVAYRRGLDCLVGGMCETDFSGYPDCRQATMTAMSETLRLGLDRECPIETPLMSLSKAQTWSLAEALGGPDLVEIIRRDTHSCYLGERMILHEWGYGCGGCPACELRAAGWRLYRDGAA